MKSSFEEKSDRNKALSTLGYGIMWLFIVFLAGILPFYTGNSNIVFYASGILALIAGIYKTARGIAQLNNLRSV